MFYILIQRRVGGVMYIINSVSITSPCTECVCTVSRAHATYHKARNHYHSNNYTTNAEQQYKLFYSLSIELTHWRFVARNCHQTYNEKVFSLVYLMIAWYKYRHNTVLLCGEMWCCMFLFMDGGCNQISNSKFMSYFNKE